MTLLLESVVKEIIKGEDPSGLYRLLRTNRTVAQYLPDVLDRLTAEDRKRFKAALMDVSFAYKNNPIIKDLL